MKPLLLKIFDKKSNLIKQVIWEYDLPIEEDIIKFKVSSGKEIICKILQMIYDLSDKSILIKTDYEGKD
jgi:hypothetical protein